MSFRALKKTFQQDRELPPRAHDLSSLRRVIQGTQYDQIAQEFHEETTNNGQTYVPIRQRRPSVRYPLCRLLVEDSISMLFSGDHLPTVTCSDEPTQTALLQIAKDCNLSQALIEAAMIGSVGSVVLFLRVLRNIVYVEALKTEYLTPTWNPEAPDELVSVREKRKTRGKDLLDAGYDIADEDVASMFWFEREWTAMSDTWFVPKLVDSRGEKAQGADVIDKARTTQHDLGFVPMVWIKNLPGGDQNDGLPTFTPEMVDVQIEIEYLLSQGGRGLKYSADPLLLIKEPAGTDSGDIVRSASNALIVDKDGDAKLVEISGSAATAIMEWVRFLRELALEGAHGNRASAEKLSAAQSGKAMELMNQALIWLTDKLRVTYGEIGLLNLYGLIVKASHKIKLLNRDGSKIAPMSLIDPLGLRWPDWYAPTSKDRQEVATTLRILVDAGIMSREKAVETIASLYDIEDTKAELLLIEAEMQARNAMVQPAGVQEKIKVSE